MSAKLEAALAAARRGFSVFPIVPESKTPLIKSWQHLATTDEAIIRQWWWDTPDANIATTTNDLIVVDVDPRNGGGDTFTGLALIEDFPKTTRSATQGGGDHIVYASPHPVKGGTNKLGPGIDVKARGGYILLPGSTIGGKAYSWGNDRPIAPAPQWIVDRCNAARPKTDTAGQRIIEEDDTARELAERWMLEHAPSAEYGEIDDTTYKVAAKLYDFGVSRETALDIMQEWNEIKCSPPGDAERLEVVVESAGRNRENAIGKAHPDAPGFMPVEIDEGRAPSIIGDAGPVLPRPKLYAIRADEGARMALAKRGEPLIDGVIDCGTMSVLVGKGGGGKTFLAMDWAYHVATGRQWAGKDVKQGAVVYLAAEAGNMILSRLAALECHYGALGDAPLYVIPCPANFSRSTDDIKAILEIIRDIEASSGQKVELFVVDTLARVMTGDENSTKDMGVIIESVDFIRQRVGCHGMLIHHPNKAGTSARGSGNVFGGCDTEMWVEDKVLSFTKQRDNELGKEIKFKLHPVRIGDDAKGRPVTSCVVHVSTPGQTDALAELSPRMLDVWGQLSAALSDAGKTSFDMAFLRTIGFRHSSDTRLARTTLFGWMSELSESGYLRKKQFGQWVTTSVETVESVENESGQVSTDSPTPLGGGSDTTVIRQHRKRAKRKTR